MRLREAVGGRPHLGGQAASNKQRELEGGPADLQAVSCRVSAAAERDAFLATEMVRVSAETCWVGAKGCLEEEASCTSGVKETTSII